MKDEVQAQEEEQGEEEEEEKEGGGGGVRTYPELYTAVAVLVFLRLG